MAISQPTMQSPHTKVPLKASLAKLSPSHAKPGRKERYTAEQVTAALHQSRGMVTAAARVLGCNRQVVYNYRSRYPQIDEVLTEARELQLDRTELALFRAIDKGESWAITLYLKTQGRERGYTAKQDAGRDAATLEQLVLQAHARRAERLANTGT
ncbi:MAG: hypothetical protein JW395_4189 [Nitrospira sp.]|nr:hypothetical protein [Nitrospira sp.]